MKDKGSPFDHCLLFTANALARTITRLADEKFAEHGFSYSQAFIILHATNNPGVTIGELSEVLQLSPSTVSRLAEKLENNGYIKRQAAGRIIRVNATPKGQKLATKLQITWDTVIRNYGEILGKEQSVKLTNRTLKATRKLEAARGNKS